MSNVKDKQSARTRRHFRVRKKVHGTEARPRLAVFRSNQHVVAQVIDDVSGRTGGFMYHGRVAALADAARESGLEF